FIPINRQRQHARHAWAVERQRAQRQLRDRHVLQIIVKKCLDPLIGGAKVSGEQSFLLSILRNESRNNVAKIRVVARGHWLKTEQRQFDVEVGDQRGGGIGGGGTQAASSSTSRMGLWTSVLMAMRFMRQRVCGIVAVVPPVARSAVRRRD